VSAPSSTAQQVLLPDLGESVTEGVIVEWRKGVGDVVQVGETLVDVTTDKVDVEVPAPAGGRITRIAAEPGETVAVGALLAELAPLGDDESAPNGGPPAPAAEAPAAEAPPAEARAVPIVLPDMESVTEATVVEWRKAVGDAVAQDEIVVEVSTDKVDLEVPAPAAGTLTRIDVQAGDTFPVSQPLGEIAAGAAATAPGPTAPAAPAGPPAAEPAAPGPDGAVALGGHASPLARRIAGAHGVDVERLPGSGPGGQVRRRDVIAAVSAEPAPAARSAAPAPVGEA
jgi:pyruvate/2-oxoglutarate dehydrogenase complex dihydrolipoamide acyltransferase (E2) component